MQREERVEKLFASTQAMIRAWKGYFFRVLGPEKISLMQMSLLFYLNTHGRANGRAIASALQLSPSAAAQLIESLDHAGYIEREISTEDRRVTYFSLSFHGKQKVADLEGKSRKFFLDATAALSDEEIATMITSQQKIIDQIHANQTKQTGANE